jgi:hypothetical protein
MGYGRNVFSVFSQSSKVLLLSSSKLYTDMARLLFDPILEFVGLDLKALYHL